MVTGSCLCGSVRFEYAEPTGQFVLCHCNRCRKSSGSAFYAAMLVRNLTFLSGQDQIASYEAPILISPPPYRRDFCARCGSPLPWPTREPDIHAIPAGSLNDDPGIRPEGHVWWNQRAPWYEDDARLPRYTDAEFVLRRVQEWDRRGDERASAGYEYILRGYPEAAEVVQAARTRLEEMKGGGG